MPDGVAEKVVHRFFQQRGVAGDSDWFGQVPVKGHVFGLGKGQQVLADTRDQGGEGERLHGVRISLHLQFGDVQDFLHQFFHMLHLP